MLIPIIVFIIAGIMLRHEIRNQGRRWPEVRGWWLRAAFLNALQLAVVFLAGVTWDKWLIQHQPWALNHLGNTAGALLGYFVITFIFYWWHRLRHKSNFLWRWVHQIHHSPKRLEIITAFYKHPIELVADSVICSVILYGILGLNPVAASYAVLLSAIAELFYHWNVKTPYWVGFIFQRPESHCIHHQEGVHHYNYADLPLWDMLFGTFKNPKEFTATCGLGEGEHELKKMLLGKDVSNPNPKKQRYWPAYLLTALGLLQMTGELFHLPLLKKIGLATNSSPAPKVFCTADSLETFSSKFYIEWQDHQLQITPEIAQNLQGPYNRRNVYGAVLSYGPVLEKSPLKPLYDSVLSYDPRSFLSELGIDPAGIDSFQIRVEPRPGYEPAHLPLIKEVEVAP